MSPKPKVPGLIKGLGVKAGVALNPATPDAWRALADHTRAPQ